MEIETNHQYTVVGFLLPGKRVNIIHDCNILISYNSRKAHCEANRTNERRSEMERLTIPDKKIDGGLRRAIIDAREVRKEAMTIYWALKKYEDTELTPEQIMELKERDTAKEILHIHQEFSEHQWRRTAEGKIDEFAMYVDCHSGPVCERCGYSFCEHCEPNGWDEEPCVIDEYRCPTCNENIGRSDKYCKYCGQRLK